MTIVARQVVYRDRGLAISDHAVERVRLRAPGCAHLDNERIRTMIADAARRGPREAHYVPGQWRAIGQFLGVELYVVVGRDKTGWGRSGEAVATVLTPEQVAARERE